jgi:polysaccharide biosynthesis protein PslH
MGGALRVLILLPSAPRRDSVHGGGRVQAQFLSQITSRHEVAVVCFRDEGDPGSDPYFVERCAVLEEVVRPASIRTSRVRRYLQIVGTFARLRPLWVHDWSARSFSHKVNEVVSAFRPDIIQYESHVMAQYLTDVEDGDARRVLVQHEPGTRSSPYLQGLAPFVGRLAHRIEKMAWRRYETAVYRRVDAVVVFTDADRRIVGTAAGPTPVHVIAPGTIVPDHPLDPAGRWPPSLVFVGNFIHPPNVDAARRLIGTILPAVRERIPDVTLFVVGDRPPNDLVRESRGDVVVTGRVEDITPYLDAAAVVVAPMHLGGGMRIKVLEALAAGKAVVATPLAVEGLAVSDGREVSVAGDDRQFAERVVELLTDDHKRRSMASAAHEWAREHLGWDRTLADYEALYAGLGEDRREPENHDGWA